MLDIGWSELLVIAVVAIIFVGPRDLVPMLRNFGKYAAKLKKMAAEFQTQFNEALEEADLDDLSKTVSDVRNMTPLNSLKKQFESEMGEIGDLTKSVASPAAAPSAPRAKAPARKKAASKSATGGKSPSKAAAKPAAKAKGAAGGKATKEKTATSKSASGKSTGAAGNKADGRWR